MVHRRAATLVIEWKHVVALVVETFLQEAIAAVVGVMLFMEILENLVGKGEPRVYGLKISMKAPIYGG